MGLKEFATGGLVDVIKVLSHQWKMATLSGVISLLAWRHLSRYLKRSKVQRKIMERGERSRVSLDKLRAEIKQEKNINMEIPKMSFQELQSALQDGRLKAVDVLNAYVAKALQVNEVTNAITDYVAIAKAEAQALDNKQPSDRGLLHGIPISVKESSGLKGEDCTAGLAAFIDTPMKQDSVMVKVMKSHGAVPFVRTNLPQAMRSFACDNPIFGLTSNPLDATRSPGGSSGGEGAIVGGGGSILGIGSDIAGSVRIPAAFCGIAGLKPTAGRLSYVGNFGTGTRIGGQTLVLGSEGPMGRDVYSVVQYMRAALSPQLFEMDPTVPPIPFRDEVFQGKCPLRIGYYTYDGCTRCVPAVIKGVKVTKEALERLGHTVVEFEPFKPPYAINQLLWPALFGDDLNSYADLVKHDNTCDILFDLVKQSQRPYFVRWLKAKWTQRTTNDPMNVGLIGRKPTRTVQDWWHKSLDFKAYQGQFLQRWKEQNLDLIICPCMPSVAMKHGLDRKMLATVTYTALYNVVNYPAGTLPVTSVTADDVARTADPAHYPAKTAIEKLIKEDAMTSEGMPVGVQLVSLPYQEELVLRVMAELEDALAS